MDDRTNGSQQYPLRDVTTLIVATVGSIDSVEGVPGVVLRDAADEPVPEVGDFFATMLASGASPNSLRSYGLALLRWWRFLAAIGVSWDRATRLEARDFVLWMRVVGPDNREYGTIDRYDDAAVYVQGQRVPYAAVGRVERDRLILDEPELYATVRGFLSSAAHARGLG